MSLQAENLLLGDVSDGSAVGSEFLSTSSIMESTNLIYETMRSTPRSNIKELKRPLSAGSKKSPSRLRSPTQPRLLPVFSNIPLPLKHCGPIKVPSLIKNVRSTDSRSLSITASRISTGVNNKHTLEIQFINKHKRYLQMKQELTEKQKPVMDLYKNLLKIKNKLEQLGKTVKIEEIKFVPVNEYENSLIRNEGDGENVSNEVIQNMRNTLEKIPKTLMDVCKNLLSRRALIVELLDKLANSEVDISEVALKIETLKNEGQLLENSLQAIITDHQNKINELVAKWESLLSSKQSNVKAEELEAQLHEQQRLMQQSNHLINDLQRKMDDRRVAYDKSIAELNGIIHTLRDQIKKLEHDLECERKATVDIKTRNTTNSKMTKTMREKINELENENKNLDAATFDWQRKHRMLQEQLKNKETQWLKEKEEMSKSLKQQDRILKKITNERTNYETTLEAIEIQKLNTEEELQNQIDCLKNQLINLHNETEEITKQRNEAQDKCAKFEIYLTRMGLENKETMNKVYDSIKNGKGALSEEAEHLREDIAKDLKISTLQDRMMYLEKERLYNLEEKKLLEEQERNKPTETEKELSKQQECIFKYKLLLEDSENKLNQKHVEVANLQSEIRQLKVRQEALEEQNFRCPTDELQKMVEEGRYKLNELMKKSIDNEQRLQHYLSVIEKQTQQMSEMENLLRYRDNMTGVLKVSRDELIMEKESLIKYSQEMRTLLADVTKEGKMKERLIKELQDKIELREIQVNKLEREVKKLESNLLVANEKRFKLQETVEVIEKELQSTKAHVIQLADINSRSGRPKFIKPF